LLISQAREDIVDEVLLVGLEILGWLGVCWWPWGHCWVGVLALEEELDGERGVLVAVGMERICQIMCAIANVLQP
jgi:hypothetical protein